LDTDDENFTFVKRIVGVIDVASATRTEHEITDEVLSDMYEEKFNKETAAAIGIHKICKRNNIIVTCP
jgi:hypothetical protein